MFLYANKVYLKQKVNQTNLKEFLKFKRIIINRVETKTRVIVGSINMYVIDDYVHYAETFCSLIKHWCAQRKSQVQYTTLINFAYVPITYN